jgi:nucleotide-binding universal stress UspA family protein
MTTHVLVPIDGSPLSSKALEVALTDYPDAEVRVLHVMDPIGSGFSIVDVMRPKFGDGAPPGSVTEEYWAEWYDSSHERAESLFEAAHETAAAYDATVETATEVGDPATEIVAYADEHGSDRIVMGSHGRSGAKRLFLGSVAETVARRAPIPVMIVH